MARRSRGAVADRAQTLRGTSERLTGWARAAGSRAGTAPGHPVPRKETRPPSVRPCRFAQCAPSPGAGTFSDIFQRASDARIVSIGCHVVVLTGVMGIDDPAPLLSTPRARARRVALPRDPTTALDHDSAQCCERMLTRRSDSGEWMRRQGAEEGESWQGIRGEHHPDVAARAEKSEPHASIPSGRSGGRRAGCPVFTNGSENE
jgi:hypothetical protein